MDRNYVMQQLANWYASQGLTPTGPGTGPTDINYYADKVLETGGWTNQTAQGGNNIGYWTNRIAGDASGAGGGGGTADASGGDPTADLANTPGFQFRLDQGLQGLQRSAAARGTLLTGGTLKGLTRYAQDYASNEYQNRVNQLTGLAQLGSSAASGQANLGSGYASLAGNLLGGQATNAANLITGGGSAAANLMTGIGNSQSAGTVSGANALSQGLTGTTNLAQQYYLLSLLGNKSPTTPTSGLGVGTTYPTGSY
jgi:hypothetical protein